MCSTCNISKYEEYEVENKGRVTKRLKNIIDESGMTCDLNGKNFKIGNFSILRCPICGRELFENYMKIKT